MFLKSANLNLISNDLLVAQDLWEEKEARNSVKVAQTTYGWQYRLHLPATGTLNEESSLQSSCQPWS